MQLDRREVIAGLVGVGAVGLVACERAEPSLRARPGWIDRLPAERRQALTAAVERVLPGAVAAGAMAYIDYWVARPPFSFAQRELDTAALLMNRTAQQRFGKAFSVVSGPEQDVVLKEFRDGKIQGKHFDSAAFFKRLVTLTLESFLGDPKYGGNQHDAGWRFINWHPCWYSPKRVDQLGPRTHGLPY